LLLSAQVYVWLRKPKAVQEEKAIEAQVPATPFSGLAE
jgi:putative tricarboxylic transport membrane protein